MNLHTFLRHTATHTTYSWRNEIYTQRFVWPDVRTYLKMWLRPNSYLDSNMTHFMCDVTRLYVRRELRTWLIAMCKHDANMPHTHVWRDSFICANMTHDSNMTHFMCDVTHLYVRTYLKTWLRHTVLFTATVTATAHGGDQTWNMWISRSIGMPDTSDERRGLYVHIVSFVGLFFKRDLYFEGAY